MKKSALFILLFVITNMLAQLTIVQDLSGLSTNPKQTTQDKWVNNFWNGKWYYQGTGSNVKICSTDGTSSGTVEIVDLGATTNGLAIVKIIPAQDFFYFQLTKTISFSPFIVQEQLWRCDGTSAGTYMIKQFDQHSGSVPGLDLTSDFDEKENYSINGNEIIFGAFSTTEGYELWKSDGTVSGTSIIKDINSGTGNSNVNAYTRLGAFTYFFATDSGSNSRLWKTDGTSSGTVALNVPDLLIYNNGMNIINNKLVFMGFDAINGIEPWVSDGTETGTHIIKNTSPRTDATYVSKKFILRGNGSALLFTQPTETSTTNITLWKTDGTESGTIQLSAIGALTSNNISDIDYAITNERMYVYNANTKKLGLTFYNENDYSDINLPNGSTNILRNMYNFNRTCWYNFFDTVFGYELFRSDGTQANTGLAFDLVSGNGNPFGYFSKDGFLYFFAFNKLYKFNGDYTFNGSISNNWGNKNNWNSTLIPISTDNVTIPSGKNVTIDIEAYTKDLMINSPINLSSGNLNVSGSMILLGGNKVTLNSNNLNLKQSATLQTGSNADYIVTNGTGSLSKENFSGTYGFPIGTLSNYNPVVFTNLGTPDTFSFRVSDGITSTNPSVNTTWEISEAVSGGSNANLTLGWNQSQENSGFDRNSAKIGHFTGGTWVQENSGTVSGTNPYTITATGITSFSPFSVMNFSTLGNSEVDKSKVQVYPNPFNENLNISTQENGVVYFYDLSGKLVSTSILMKGNNQLQKSSLTKGIYFYNIKNTNGEIVLSGKVIKK